MTKEELKNKVKKFSEDHATDIAYWKGVGVAMIGFVIGSKLMSRKGTTYTVTNENLKVLFDDIAKMDTITAAYSGISDAPIKVADMGKLGEEILKYGGNVNHELTHFFMVSGKTNK